MTNYIEIAYLGTKKIILDVNKKSPILIHVDLFKKKKHNHATLVPKHQRNFSSLHRGFFLDIFFTI